MGAPYIYIYIYIYDISHLRVNIDHLSTPNSQTPQTTIFYVYISARKVTLK